MRVLAVGATGQFAGLVVPALVAKSLQVRALVHDPAKADLVRALADLPAGDMRDGLSAMFADYTAHGFHGGNNLVLRTILGRAREHSTAFSANSPPEPGSSTRPSGTRQAPVGLPGPDVAAQRRRDAGRRYPRRGLGACQLPPESLVQHDGGPAVVHDVEDRLQTAGQGIADRGIE
jgi:NmrA-like family